MREEGRGQLVLVATPIGNLGDMTTRAVEVLRAAAFVVCEDTRHSGPWLRSLGVEAPLLSLPAFAEKERIGGIVDGTPRLRRVATVESTPELMRPRSVAKILGCTSPRMMPEIMLSRAVDSPVPTPAVKPRVAFERRMSSGRSVTIPDWKALVAIGEFDATYLHLEGPSDLHL